MPEIHHETIYNIPPLRKKLRIKLSLILLLATLLPFLVGLVLIISLLGNSSQQEMMLEATAYLIIPFILASALGILAIWKSLKPITYLYEQIQILIKGGVWNREILQTDDEIESISDLFHQVSRKITITSEKGITERDYISAEKNKLNAIISSMIDGIIVLDLHRSVVLINKSAEKLTGYKYGEMVGNKIEDLISLKDSNGKNIDIKDLCRIDPEEKEFSSIPRMADLTGKSKQKAQIKLTTVKVSEDIQTDLGCILVLHDNTKEDMFEQMQIDFVSMASHEFRTPLTSITNYLSVLQEEASKKLTKEQREFLERALDSSKQLAELVSNLLNVSKIERGSFAILPQLLDWEKELKQVVEDNKAQAIKKNISLFLKLEDKSMPPVLADKVRITEVLNNLINNAINYTKEGGHIEVGAKVEGEMITTHVTDNGVGIPKEAVSHLFSKFFRAPDALKQMREGSGLGLYISKSIIDLHKGKIWVESEIGKGSTFSFSLPKAADSQASFIDDRKKR